MKRIVTIVLSCLALVGIIVVLGGIVFASDNTTAPNNTAATDGTGLTTLPGVIWSQQSVGLWVNGEGKVTAVPDIAILTLGVEVQKTAVADAQQQAATSMDAVMKVLKGKGIADKDIQTQGYSISPVWQYNNKDGSQTLIGYKVDNTIVAKIRNLNNVGSIIDAVAGAAGNDIRINDISFSIDDPTPIINQARDKALADAMAKAKQIATDTNVTLGKTIYISESSPATPIRTTNSFAASGSMAAPAVPTQISAGSLDITVDVQMVFNIN